ncbi:nucleolar protein 58-like [Dreissena polymorpha]|uniref:nucleolar protein 58-like n=1 Tax=Dreissena polymorpha TaxID=45954 RepID=UPI00226417D8|nr:nucleolar protein 58-like [Dreissena polymorpha]
MSDYKDIIRKPETLNWFKAAMGMNITRHCLLDIVKDATQELYDTIRKEINRKYGILEHVVCSQCHTSNDDLTQKENVCTKARDVGREVRHAPAMSMNSQDSDRAIDTLEALMQSLTHVNHQVTAKTAVDKLKQRGRGSEEGGERRESRREEGEEGERERESEESRRGEGESAESERGEEKENREERNDEESSTAEGKRKRKKEDKETKRQERERESKKEEREKESREKKRKREKKKEKRKEEMNRKKERHKEKRNKEQKPHYIHYIIYPLYLSLSLPPSGTGSSQPHNRHGKVPDALVSKHVLIEARETHGVQYPSHNQPKKGNKIQDRLTNTREDASMDKANTECFH